MDTQPAQSFEFVKKLAKHDLQTLAEKFSLRLENTTQADMAFKLSHLLTSTEWSVCVSGSSGDAPGSGGDGKGDGDDNEHPTGSDNEDPTGSEGGDMQIFVKSPAGKTITLAVEPSDSIDVVKGLIKAKLKIPVSKQTLFKDIKELEAGTLSENFINHEDLLELHLGLLGAGKKAVIKISKHEKLVLTKVKAKATYEAIPAFVLNPEITGQANSKYNEMMETNDEDYLDGLVEKMKMSELECALEFLNENKMGEQVVHKLAPFFIPEMAALTTTASNCQKAAQALESAFVYNFTLCYLNPEYSQYDFQAFYNYVEKKYETKKIEKALMEKHGIAHDI